MNIQDRIADLFLPLLDIVLDILTLGEWSWVRGSVVPNIKDQGGE